MGSIVRALENQLVLSFPARFSHLVLNFWGLFLSFFSRSIFPLNFQIVGSTCEAEFFEILMIVDQNDWAHEKRTLRVSSAMKGLVTCLMSGTRT